MQLADGRDRSTGSVNSHQVFTGRAIVKIEHTQHISVVALQKILIWEGGLIIQLGILVSHIAKNRNGAIAIAVATSKPLS